MMTLLLGVGFFALGAVAASFAGVLAARYHTGQSWVRGRSKCDACGKELGSRVLIPIFSHLLARGRARCCGTRLSSASPLAEAVLGGLFTLSYLKLGLTLALPFFLLALVMLLALVLYDLAHQILPTAFLAVFGAAAAAAGFFSAASPGEFFTTLELAALFAAFLGAIHFFSRGRAMGFADAPLVFALALLGGTTAFTGFVFSFWIGAVIGGILLARRRHGLRMNSEVPFAPFLAAGFLLAYFTQWNILTLIEALLS